VIPSVAMRQEERSPDTRAPILIIGVGNILLSDEGVGVRVVEAIQQMKMPDNVEVLDGGTASMALLDSLGDRDKVIVIDAIKGNHEPGTLYRFTPDDISAQREVITSIHQLGVLDALAHVEYMGCAPKSVVFFGIEPDKLDLGLELTPKVKSKIPRVIELVLRELGISAQSTFNV
jgi:hydrogenase maturation protease